MKDLRSIEAGTVEIITSLAPLTGSAAVAGETDTVRDRERRDVLAQVRGIKRS